MLKRVFKSLQRSSRLHFEFYKPPVAVVQHSRHSLRPQASTSFGQRGIFIMPKRKSTSAVEDPIVNGTSHTSDGTAPPPLKRRASARKASSLAKASTNPDVNANVLDAPQALRASPDASGSDERLNVEAVGMNAEEQIKEEQPLAANADTGKASKGKKSRSKAKTKESADKKVKVEDVETGEIANPKKEKPASKEPSFLDPEADGVEEADEEELKEALYRPPPINSDYLPLPWKGRLGYVGCFTLQEKDNTDKTSQACLCTYLRFSNPPVFSSRTCRIASILENRHPLKDPNAPPHATKNRPDKDKPAEVARGQAFVESLGKANARDIIKMLWWNEKYGIRFMRLSSEMFPFASHEEYGYKLAPFVSEELAEVGKLAAQLGHRLTTHPGQYTQLGSPRKQVIDNALRDLDYHAELLDLLKLPPQQDRDAVMILHLGGVFGDKEATIQRFKDNYKKLPPNVKKRLVLENDDVSWSVHDLLPICEELNIPMVLDFHHNNIIFDADKIREGTKDIVDVFPRILATWKRKNITPKMHYSEPTPEAITGRQRRKHNPRVATLPPCPPDMDLMIEAKDKEQAVFELMRTFRLPGHHLFNDISPHVRNDDNKPAPTPKKKSLKKKSKKVKEEDDDAEAAEDTAEEPVQQVVPDEEVGMGGPDRRVYWPPGQEHWLRPVKRVIKPKKETNPEGEAEKKLTPAQKKKAAAEAAKEGAKIEEELHANGVKAEASVAGTPTPTPASRKGKAAAKGKAGGAKKGGTKKEETPVVTSEDDESELSDLDMDDASEEELLPAKKATGARANRSAKPNGVSKTNGRRASGRAKKVVYTEAGDENEDE